MGIFKIYTDGSCILDHRAGGYCAIIKQGNGDKEKIISGSKEDATNNEMELFAVVAALRQFDKHRKHRIYIFSDSAYVINSIKKKWIKNWIKNGWKNSSNKAVKNPDLWLELYNMLLVLDVKFVKVKAHSGNVLNERCDKIARKHAQKLQRMVKNDANKR